MPAPRIRVDHDKLLEIYRGFARNATDFGHMQRKIQRQMDTLRGGDWIGKGANAFYAEMDGDILPALKRLVAAMQAADRTTRQIIQIMLDAENDAAALFRLGVAPGPGPAIAGSIAGAVTAKLDSVRQRLISAASSAYKWLTTLNSVKSLADAFAEAGWAIPNTAKFLKENPYWVWGGRSINVLGAGVDGVIFAEDPNIQTGANLGVSATAAVGGFFSKAVPALAGGSVAAVTGTFAASYGLTTAFVAPHVSGPFGDALASWDPFNMGFSPSNHPRVFIEDYQRSGQEMPIDIAREVHTGFLRRNDTISAAKFAEEYCNSTGTPPAEFHASWFKRLITPGI